jgi:hypothetical protein
MFKRDGNCGLSIAGWRSASHRSRIFLHSYPSFIDRETTAAPEWIEMACRLDHRIAVEVGGDSTEDVDLKHNAGASPVEPERPERLMAGTSARVRSTASSSTTPTTRELRRDDDAGVVVAAGRRVAVR